MPSFIKKPIETVKSKLGEIRLMASFANDADLIMKEIANHGADEASSIKMRFEQQSETIVKYIASADLIVGGRTVHVDDFMDRAYVMEDLPQYLAERIKSGDDTIDFNADDLRQLKDETQYPMSKKAEWENIVNSYIGKRLQLTDRVFYTMVKVYNPDGMAIIEKRIGKIAGIPQKIADQVYPFKEYTLQL
ncbi:MAG: hypothetical protein IJ760_07060 [Bacteroidales bacterium]|nr:hypothetical protein [Bacteroidales bacterium]